MKSYKILQLLVVILSSIIIVLGGYIYINIKSNETKISVKNNNSFENNGSIENKDLNNDTNSYENQNGVHKTNDISDIFDAEYDTVVFVNENNVYYTKTHDNGFFWENEIIKVNTNNINVSKVRTFSTGTDPAQTIFIISEDGDVYVVDQTKNTIKINDEVKNYKIKDIIDIEFYLNEETGNFMNTYKVILQDGTEKVIKES